MAQIVLDQVGKVYPDGYRAVADLTVAAHDGELLVIVGPSGCGKSTALRMIAGLEDVTEGTVMIGEREVNRLPPRDRDVAMVFQSYALYPHLNVRDNIGFGLKLRKAPKTEIRQRVDDAAGILGLQAHLERKPGNLSGGQRQRVAMGRALVRQPQCFLMDEPLSNLDAQLRTAMRAEIARLQKDLAITTVYVTHDQTEAMTLGDRVAVMNNGVVQQVCDPQQLYDRPANVFVASFIGTPPMNLLYGRLDTDVDGPVLILGDNKLRLDASALTHRPGLASRLGEDVIVGIRPEDLEDARVIEHSGGQVVTAPVTLTEATGSDLMVHCTIAACGTGVGEISEPPDQKGHGTSAAAVTSIIARFGPRARVMEGQSLDIWVDTQRLHWFAPETGEAIG